MDGWKNKSKRKINLNPDQSQATDRLAEGAGIYRRITTDVLKWQFHHKRRVELHLKTLFFFFFTTSTPTESSQWTGTKKYSIQKLSRSGRIKVFLTQFALFISSHSWWWWWRLQATDTNRMNRHLNARAPVWQRWGAPVQREARKNCQGKMTFLSCRCRDGCWK